MQFSGFKPRGSSETTNTVSDDLSFNKPPQQSDKSNPPPHPYRQHGRQNHYPQRCKDNSKTANFERHSLSGMTLGADMIKQREIHLAIPAQTNTEQRLQLQRVVEYGKNRNITVKITEIK